MGKAVDKRYLRIHTKSERDDQRNAAQRDRDRVLYCSAFRRLAEITQVVSAAEGHSFHNRLTHSLKVAQIARRLAEYLRSKQKAVAAEIGGPDPDVAETAALAHDLGHPPFGHIAEVELNELARKHCKNDDGFDGFEGNAQSFRIVTRLAVRTTAYDGLNLTAASLNGLAKYPWPRAADGSHSKKWGVYTSELDDFKKARAHLGYREGNEARSVEAEIMDWADDIAYSVFDVDDFYRAGLIPLDRILADTIETERFLRDTRIGLIAKGTPSGTIDGYERAFKDLILNLSPRGLDGRFQETVRQRAEMRALTSWLVGRYVNAIRLVVPTNAKASPVVIDEQLNNEVQILKQLVWHYVIQNPALLTQQHGERHVIRGLFQLYMGESKNVDFFPAPFREALKADDAKPTRIVIDMIASLTETQAVRLYQRLKGTTLGSILDRL